MEREKKVGRGGGRGKRREVERTADTVLLKSCLKALGGSATHNLYVQMLFDVPCPCDSAQLRGPEAACPPGAFACSSGRDPGPGGSYPGVSLSREGVRDQPGKRA